MITDFDDVKGTIIGHRGDRFGGRFAAILSAMRAADIQNIPFRICWSTPPDWEEVCHPEDLFSQEFMDQKFIDQKTFNSIRWKAKQLNRWSYDEADFRRMIDAGEVFLNEDTRATGFPWENPDDVRVDIPKYWKRVGFSAAMQVLVDRVDAAFEVAETTVAYHVRRGDLVDDHQFNSHRLHARGKYIPTEIYAEHIEQTLTGRPNSQIVVFTDEPRIIDQLSQRFPQIRGIRSITGSMDMTLGQRDFLELYTMSKCPVIVGPPHSAFSASAAMLGNGRVISVTDDLDPDRLQAALEKIAANFETGVGAFLCQGDMGQCLPYYLDHRDSQGRGAEATQTLRHQIAEGFDRSHAFPSLAARYFKERAFGALEELREAASNGLVMFDTVATVETYRALAEFVQGNTAQAHRNLAAAHFLEPLDSLRDSKRLMERMIAFAMQSGEQIADALPPFDPELTWVRRALFDEPEGPFQDLNRGINDGNKAQDFLTEVIGRDWMGIGDRRLFPAGMVGRFRNPNMAAPRFEKLLSRLKEPESPSTRAARGALERGIERFDRSKELIDAALADCPEHPLYLKRRADLHFDMEEPDQGFACLEQAQGLAGGNIWYDAHMAWRLTQFGDDQVKSFSALEALVGREHGFPSIRFFVAGRIFHRAQYTELALSEIDVALEHVPGAPGLKLLRGRILARMGKVDEARSEFNFVELSREHERQAAAALASLEKAQGH